MKQRKNVFQLVYKWENSNYYIDHLLEQNDLNSFEYRLIKGVIENKIYLEYIIDNYLKRPVGNKIKIILKIALYEILFNDSSVNYATVNEAVELAKEYGKQDKGLVNAVLRNFIRDDCSVNLPKDKKSYLSVKYSFPVWIIDIYSKYYSYREIENLFKYFFKDNYLDLRINTRAIKKSNYLDYLKKRNIKYEISKYLPYYVRILDKIKVSELPGFDKGFFYIQDKAAQLISQSVLPLKGNFLDVGSAPGGKLSYFAQAADENKNNIYGIEKSKKRMNRLKNNLNRLKINNVNLIQEDFLTYKTKVKFDKIFLDVPCSGLGVLSKKIDIKYRLKKKDLISLYKLQQKLIKKAAELIKKKGVIYYSTCTLNYKENEGVISNFIKNNDYKYYNINQKKCLNNILSSDSILEKGMYRTNPADDNMDGMFLVSLKRSD